MRKKTQLQIERPKKQHYYKELKNTTTYTQKQRHKSPF
jgi:hypothetical protein